MHHIEHGLAPKEATIKAMEEVSGPVVAIGLILAAVFVPVGFMGGITGRLYQQFAITIAISVLLSVVNALTLSPALAALLAESRTARRRSLLTPFYDWFNRVFGRYDGCLRELRRHPDSEDAVQLCVHRAADLRDRRARPAHSGRVRARGGPGLHHRQRAVAGRRLARAHGRRHAEGRGRSGEERRRSKDSTRSRGYSLVTRRVLVEHGLLLRAAQAVARSPHARVARDRRSSPRSTRVQAGHSRGGGGGVRSAVDSRSRALAPDSRSNCRIAAAGRPSTWRNRRSVSCEAARKRPEIGRINTLYRATVPQVFADIDRSKVLKSGVLAERREHDAWRPARQFLRQRLQPLRPRLQGLRPGRSRSSAKTRGNSGCSSCAATTGAHGAARHAGLRPPGRRTGIHQPLQLASEPRSSRVCRLPGYSSAQALDALEQTATRRAAAGHELRLGRHVVPGAQGTWRRGRVRARDLPGLPDSGGAVRELGTAVQRAAGHAVRRVRCLPRALGDASVLAELRQQRVRADRSRSC